MAGETAAAAHAKGPARPVVQSAFRAKGLWRKTRKFLNFLLILQLLFKTRVALPEATPSPFGTATLRLVPQRPNALRAVQHIFYKNPLQFIFSTKHYVRFASIAQLVEHGTENPCVAGSIPARGTIIFSLLSFSFLWF